MNINYGYPVYKIDLNGEMLEECCDIAVRLLKEVGLAVRHEKFLDVIRTKPGIKIEGQRVHFDESLIRKTIEKYISNKKDTFSSPDKKADNDQWQLSSNGFSMCVRDIETDEVREATCQDLRDLIKLKDSFGISGSYPVMPQELPPLMRAVACFKICWESSDKTRPFDYLDIRQAKYIYEMSKVMGKDFIIVINIPQTMTVSEEDLETFVRFYPDWKKNKDISLYSIADYPMTGITKPITATGSIALQMAHRFGTYTLFNLFDPEIEIPFGLSAGIPTDLRHVCWAFGSPRTHLYSFLTSRIIAGLTGCGADTYLSPSVLLASSSSAVDEQAALEKMGVGLTAALQGCRSFSGTGNLCVDDLFSGVQFVIDVEIFNYIKETIESFDPHPDIISMDGLYELLRDVSLGKEQFLSHPDTATKFKNILPSSDLIHREKLRSWLGHKKILKDRAQEECLKRIKDTEQGFKLPEDKQKALDQIYKKAEADLLG